MAAGEHLAPGQSNRIRNNFAASMCSVRAVLAARAPRGRYRYRYRGVPGLGALGAPRSAEGARLRMWGGVRSARPPARSCPTPCGSGGSGLPALATKVCSSGRLRRAAGPGRGARSAARTPALCAALTRLARPGAACALGVRRACRSGDRVCAGRRRVGSAARRAARHGTCRRGSAVNRVCAAAVPAGGEGRALRLEARRCRRVWPRAGFCGALALDAAGAFPLVRLFTEKAAGGKSRRPTAPPGRRGGP